MSYQEARAIAAEYQFDAYFECDAKTGIGIDDAFGASFELVVERTGYWEQRGKAYQRSPVLAQGLLREDIKPPVLDMYPTFHK